MSAEAFPADPQHPLREVWRFTSGRDAELVRMSELRKGDIFLIREGSEVVQDAYFEAADDPQQIKDGPYAGQWMICGIEHARFGA